MFGFKNKNKQQNIAEELEGLEDPSDNFEMINSMAVFAGLEKPIYKNDDNGIVSYNVSRIHMLRSKKDNPIFKFYNNNDIDFVNVNNKACCVIKDKNFEDEPPFFASDILINLNKQDDDNPDKLLLEDSVYGYHHNYKYVVYGSDIFEVKKGEGDEVMFKITILILLENKDVIKVYKFDFRFKKSCRHKDYLFKEDPVFIGSIFNILAEENEYFALDVLKNLNMDHPKVFL